MIHLVEPPAFAIDWCHRLGADLDTLKPLRGGINNKVFRCTTGEHKFVLKGYALHRAGDHDRFKAEVEFLNYARMVAPEFVPQLLGSDEASRSLVLESLEGEGFQEGAHPPEEDIEQAITFMRNLNTSIDLAKQYVSGSAADGFLKLTDHLRNIEQRASTMSVEHLPCNFRAEAEELIKRLSRQLDCLQEKSAHFIKKGKCENALASSARCISPSDFGFHNAIRTHQGIKFLDFEFAGWDDPAKAVADFDLQPRVPLNFRARVLSKALPQWNKGLMERYDVLFPILNLKWACIILSMLDPDRWLQMTMHLEDNICESMLQAKFHLAQIYLPKD